MAKKLDILNAINIKFKGNIIVLNKIHEIVKKSDRIKYMCIKHIRISEASISFVLNHSKYACKDCQYENIGSKTKMSLEDFINKSKNIHGDKYNYFKFKYVNNKTKGIVICNSCNKEWLVRPDCHIYGKNGCPYCKISSIYTREFYKSRGLQNHICYIYLAMFSVNGINFCKIGLTKHKNILYRFRGQAKPLALEFFKSDFLNCYDLEQKILKDFSEFKISLNFKFKGHTECFEPSCFYSILSVIKNVLRISNNTNESV